MTTAIMVNFAEVEMTVLGCMMNSPDDLQASHEIINVCKDMTNYFQKQRTRVFL